MIAEYRWASGCQVAGQDVQVIGDHLERLEADRRVVGELLKTGDIVEDARQPESPLHFCFQWNISVAAYLYHLEQARHLVNHIVVSYSGEPATKAFFHVAVGTETEDTSRGYVSVAVAMSDEALREQLVRRALREAKAWWQRYIDLEELATAHRAIEELTESHGV